MKGLIIQPHHTWKEVKRFFLEVGTLVQNENSYDTKKHTLSQTLPGNMGSIKLPRKECSEERTLEKP